MVMKSFRNLSPLSFCLSVLLTLFLLSSATSDASNSLWGKKIRFKRPRCLWQLHPDVKVPALEELTTCVLLRLQTITKWTGFVYKAPGNRTIHLGLGGTGNQLTVWLFGQEQHLVKKLKSNRWYSVCITWSGRTQKLHIYVDGVSEHKISVDPLSPKRLSSNGTLTLGNSHFVYHDKVHAETGKELFGDIGRFGLWAREWSAEDVRAKSCADGDVVSWDRRQWKDDCPPEPANDLHCAWSQYKIKMWTVIEHSPMAAKCPDSLEEVTRHWLEAIFPSKISVHDIYVSTPSRSCRVANNSAALHAPQLQESIAIAACDKCFSSEVYVNVDPEAYVQDVQTNITDLLTVSFCYDFLNLTADPHSITVLPVESFPAASEQAPSPSAETTTSGPTERHQANVSTTREPLDLNETFVGPNMFFRVNMTLSTTGSPTNPKVDIERWVKEQLEVNKTMVVLNLITKEAADRSPGEQNGLVISKGQQKQYTCIFHVQEYNINSADVTQTLIHAALTSKYDNDSFTIQTTDLMIRRIEPANCLEETTSTVYGEYIWPETFPQVREAMGCIKPKSERAYRLCKLDIETDKTSWAYPDMTKCDPLKTISDLENITVSSDNAHEVVGMIRDLVDEQLANSSELSSSDLDTVVEKLSQVVDVSHVTPAVGANIVNIVGDILLSETDVSPVSNMVLNLTEKMANNMDFQEDSVSVTAPSLALSMVNVAPEEFKGLTFGVSTISPDLNPTTFLDQSFVGEPLPDTDATISLPSELYDRFPPSENSQTRIQFQFYGTQELFQDQLLNNGTEGKLTLNSYIVSASINSSHVSNLKEKVVVTLNHQKPKEEEDAVRCVFWDFQKNDGQGGWNSSGCETRSIASNQTSCLCNHLTHFAVLLDVSRGGVSETDGQILTIISYLGCGISAIFLGITLLTYLAFEKLRRDNPSKILINLSAALMGLCMLFLLNSWLSSFSNYGLCIATAASLHYFLLASFTWMGLEAVHMYLALVKVFNIYIPLYILKFCAVGWGLPLIIVGLVLAIDIDAYGSIAPEAAKVALESSDPFCWLQNDIFFYVTVVAFFLLILLGNLSMFIVVLIQIKQTRVNKPSADSRTALQDFRAVAGLTVLLGLTWSMGFFSFGPARVVMLYLFCIFNTFQGFFIFLFHCLMKENVRKQWRMHLCCGRYRISDSDWSRSVTAGGHKNHILVNSDSVASGNTTTRKVSDLSTGSSPNHYHQGA